jgi:hypothetical protein
MKRRALILTLIVLFLAACGGTEDPPAGSGEDAAVETTPAGPALEEVDAAEASSAELDSAAPQDEAAAETAESAALAEENNEAAGAETAGEEAAGDAEERSATQFLVEGAHMVDTPRAVAAASPLPDTDAVAMQIKTAVSGSRAPAIVLLDNVPRAVGEYALTGLSFDDPQPGVVEAGVDILDEEQGGVYPYGQFADNVGGTLTINAVADNQVSGSFTFSAEGEGTAVNVSGTFANVALP